MSEQSELTGRPLLGVARDARLFVDRKAELSAISEAIQAQVNVLVLGERGAGKTSLLRQLARKLDESSFRPVFVEGGLADSPGELLTLIRARISPDAQVSGIAEQF